MLYLNSCSEAVKIKRVRDIIKKEDWWVQVFSETVGSIYQSPDGSRRKIRLRDNWANNKSILELHSSGMCHIYGNPKFS